MGTQQKRESERNLKLFITLMCSKNCIDARYFLPSAFTPIGERVIGVIISENMT